MPLASVWWVVAHGWNVGKLAAAWLCGCARVVRVRLWDWCGGRDFGALLGPEGSGGPLWLETGFLVLGCGGVLVSFSGAGLLCTGCTRVCVVSGGGLGWFWPLLENCTVDASIFIFVVKLLRAHGGCLGTRSR